MKSTLQRLHTALAALDAERERVQEEIAALEHQPKSSGNGRGKANGMAATAVAKGETAVNGARITCLESEMARMSMGINQQNGHVPPLASSTASASVSTPAPSTASEAQIEILMAVIERLSSSKMASPALMSAPSSAQLQPASLHHQHTPSPVAHNMVNGHSSFVDDNEVGDGDGDDDISALLLWKSRIESSNSEFAARVQTLIDERSNLRQQLDNLHHAYDDMENELTLLRQTAATAKAAAAAKATTEATKASTAVAPRTDRHSTVATNGDSEMISRVVQLQTALEAAQDTNSTLASSLQSAQSINDKSRRLLIKQNSLILELRRTLASQNSTDNSDEDGDNGARQ
ncbi:hypothetical protein GQ42DRAFT_162845 [Ramicandelaber brevisporus]|nr:hypothetical protein GQ42DRAFT_162845 [Ramicandelaber brevisporus]